MTVDEFIATRVLPEFRETVECIRVYVKELVPQAHEELSYGIPAYRVKYIIAVISPTKKDITLAFTRGAAFEDKFGLLIGVGHKSKHLKFKNAAEVNRDVLAYYLQQALEIETAR